MPEPTNGGDALGTLNSSVTETTEDVGTAGGTTPDGAAVLFDGTDVDQDVERDGLAPTGDSLTDEELQALDRLMTQALLSNEGLAADEQMNLDEVN